MHDAPLRLIAGADAFLRSLPMACGLATSIPVLAATSPWHFRLIALGACFMVPGLLGWHASRARPIELELGLQGKARWKRRGGDWEEGRWLERVWINHGYAVITCRGENRLRRFVVCRRLQRHEAFRILSTWVRLRPHEDSEWANRDR